MNLKERISSILQTNNLDESITGFPSFQLADLAIGNDLDYGFPQNLRLGHLIEKIVSSMVKSSCNFDVLYENIQLIENKRTIGELDFIIEENETKELIHLELAYKFYLFDPSISDREITNCIGPNRNDSLEQKLEKLKEKQFPLLYHHALKTQLPQLRKAEIKQSLCFLVSLFVPFQFKGQLMPNLEACIKGYYLDLKTFIQLNQYGKRYYLPPKKEWGMEPSKNQRWSDFNEIEWIVIKSLDENQSVLCWEKSTESYSCYFIVWW